MFEVPFRGSLLRAITSAFRRNNSERYQGRYLNQCQYRDILSLMLTVVLKAEVMLLRVKGCGGFLWGHFTDNIP